MNKLIFILCFILSTTISHKTYAIGFGEIFDILGNIYTQGGNQLANLQAILSNGKQILKIDEIISDKLTEEIKSLTGNYHLSEFLNDTTTQAERLWSANDWQSMLNEASGGNAQRFKELLHQYKQQYPQLAASQIVEGDINNLKTVFYQDAAKINHAALSSSVYVYEKLNEKIKRLQSLISAIDQSPNQKSSTDLNSRINAELGFIQLEILKLQAFQAHLIALGNQQKTNDMTTDAQFIKWK